jgi:hypothetical protein
VRVHEVDAHGVKRGDGFARWTQCVWGYIRVDVVVPVKSAVDPHLCERTCAEAYAMWTRWLEMYESIRVAGVLYIRGDPRAVERCIGETRV